MKLWDVSRIGARQDLPTLKQKIYGKTSISLPAGKVGVLGNQFLLFWLEIFMNKDFYPDLSLPLYQFCYFSSQILHST